MNGDVDVMMRLVRLISMLCARFNDLETTDGEGEGGCKTADFFYSLSPAVFLRRDECKLGRFCRNVRWLSSGIHLHIRVTNSHDRRDEDDSHGRCIKAQVGLLIGGAVRVLINLCNKY